MSDFISFDKEQGKIYGLVDVFWQDVAMNWFKKAFADHLGNLMLRHIDFKYRGSVKFTNLI